MILRRYCQHRDKLELRGNRVVGISEICDALLDRADLCVLFNGEPRKRDCGCGCDADSECEKFNRSLEMIDDNDFDFDSQEIFDGSNRIAASRARRNRSACHP